MRTDSRRSTEQTAQRARPLGSGLRHVPSCPGKLAGRHPRRIGGGVPSRELRFHPERRCSVSAESGVARSYGQFPLCGQGVPEHDGRPCTGRYRSVSVQIRVRIDPIPSSGLRRQRRRRFGESRREFERSHRIEPVPRARARRAVAQAGGRAFDVQSNVVDLARRRWNDTAPVFARAV